LVPVASLTVQPHRWRLILFRVLAALLGLVYLPGVLLVFAPWAPLSMARALPNLSVLIGAWAQAPHPDLQRFTWGLSAAVDAAIAVVLFALTWRPLARPLLVQFLALALVVDLCANVPFVPGIIVAYSPILLLLVIYPGPRRLLTPFWQGPVDWSVLTLAVVVGAFFVPDVWRAWQAQVRGVDELALNNGWASTVEHLCNLWLMALLAAARQRGSSLLALLVGPCLIYLVMAAIAVPGNRGSWGPAGGVVAIAGGTAYLAMTVRASRRASARSRSPPR
jgi:hypothetical protein